MIHGRQSQSTPGSAPSEALRLGALRTGAWKTGDAEEGCCDAADYEDGKGIKGNMGTRAPWFAVRGYMPSNSSSDLSKLDTVSKEQLQQKLDGTRRGGAALFLLFLFAVSMSVLQTTQVKLQVTRHMGTITALQERLEEMGMELDDHRTEAIDFRSKLSEAEKEHEANEKLRSEIGGARSEIATLRSDIGGLNSKLKEKTSIADRLWLENNAVFARLHTLDGEARQVKLDIDKFSKTLTV